MSLEYNTYLNDHISNLQKGLRWMDENLELSRELKSALGEAMYRDHDATKWQPTEYPAYDAYFYGKNKSYAVVMNFKYAWLHHQNHNPHHWQYWVLINDEPKEGLVPLEMPNTYILEMIADWWTFSWKNDKLGEIFDWYDEHKNYILLHKKTRKIVEDILDQMKRKLIELQVMDEKPKTDDAGVTIESDILEHADKDDEEDENKYGVPKLKKFPMPDTKHVKSAIRFFNYIDPKHEKELAEAILERAEEYGVDLSDMNIGDENRFKNYIPKKEPNEKE